MDYNGHMRLLSIGEKTLSQDEDVVSTLVFHALRSLQPKIVLSDLSNGWGLIVAEQAQRIGISVMGVYPHEEVIGNKAYAASREKIERKVGTSIVFEKTYVEYLKNPKRYVEWVLKNSDSALCYVNPSGSSLAHSLMVVYVESGKTVHNLFRRNV